MGDSPDAAAQRQRLQAAHTGLIVAPGEGELPPLVVACVSVVLAVIVLVFGASWVIIRIDEGGQAWIGSDSVKKLGRKRKERARRRLSAYTSAGPPLALSPNLDLPAIQRHSALRMSSFLDFRHSATTPIIHIDQQQRPSFGAESTGLELEQLSAQDIESTHTRHAHSVPIRRSVDAAYTMADVRPFTSPERDCAVSRGSLDWFVTPPEGSVSQTDEEQARPSHSSDGRPIHYVAAL